MSSPRRVRTHSRDRVPAAVVACVVLAGCSDPAAIEPRPTGPTVVDGRTAPGTTLAVGDTATVPLDDDAGVIELTVTGIDEGDPAQLADLRDSPGRTPVYVRMTAVAVSGDAYGFHSEESVRALSGDELIPPIATPLTVGPCTRTYFPYRPAVGTSITSCVTFAVDPGGASLDRVAFENDGDYQVEADSAVEWLP